MVSLKTVGSLAGLAVAGISIYLFLKNAPNIGNFIGSSVGQGIANIGTSFTSALGLGGVAGGGKTTPQNVNPHPEIPTVDGVNTPNDILVQQDKKVQNPDIPIAIEFKESLLAGEISEGFARKYSFREPTSGNVLDVSKTFAFLSKTEGASASKGSFRFDAEHPFGGYSNPQAQEAALVAAIERSSQQYPQYFG